MPGRVTGTRRRRDTAEAIVDAVATMTVPVVGSKARAVGRLNNAASPVPSANEGNEPASVVTWASRSVPSIKLTMRMRLFPNSATRSTALPGRIVICRGTLKRALVPVPSAHPGFEGPSHSPVSVVTTPSSVMWRIRLPPHSDTMTAPLDGTTAMPPG